MNNDKYKEGVLHGQINTIFDFMEIDKKYKFDYLDEDYDKETEELILKLEYIGKDIEWKEESDFDKIEDYDKYSEENGNIIFNKGCKLFNDIKDIIKKYNIFTKCTRIESDDYDYFVIYLYFRSKYF